jgi:tripartite-type tricarboxylate transporter receptor subunit TctC
MPTIPTIDEAGFPGFQALTWFALVAPPGTPDAITTKIYQDTLDAIKGPDVAARIAAMGMDVVGLNPKDSGKFFAQEATLWGKIIKDAQISLD